MKTLNLNTRIFLVLSIFALGSVTISAIGIFNLSSLSENIGNIVTVVARKALISRALSGDIYNIKALEYQILDEDDFKKNKASIKKIEKLEAIMDDRLVRYEKLTGPEELVHFQKMKTDVADWKKSNLEFRNFILKNNKTAALETEEGKGQETLLALEKTLEVLVNDNEKFMADAAKEANERYSSSKFIIIAVSVFALACGIFMAFLVLRAASVAIDQVISSLTDNSIQVTSAATQIASSSQELSTAATEQAASLVQTASSIEEMTSMVQKNADSSQRATELSEGSSKTAEKGKNIVSDMLKAIDDISASNAGIMEQVELSNKEISNIVKVIQEIGNKTQVINDIVFQTKLLSFNASVEAARAGEHGKGFAVVAEEVGNLAQMSGDAALEITQMLEESVKKVEKIVKFSQENVGRMVIEGRKKVEVGSKIANECEKVLNDIVDSSSNVTLISNEISMATKEQAVGAHEITKAMNQLDQVTQTNAATSEEVASVAEQLSTQAVVLKDMVGVLVKTIKGTHTEKESAPSMTKLTKVKAREAHNVIPLKRPKVQTSAFEVPLKKAVGISVQAPSENDPRFEEA
ncbi:MAG: methyl-accepting chemotaxis protein [Bacteriovoracaceae bacterium]|nr:methyl-accepting chemotaxis protein [Bacteriovoracaceae bacterium]